MIFTLTLPLFSHYGLSDLLLSWLLDVQDIYYEASRKLLVPLSSEPTNLQSFFNSLAVLMTSQLQELALFSLRDYTSLISPVGDPDTLQQDDSTVGN